jgi:hypothetical protein
MKRFELPEMNISMFDAEYTFGLVLRNITADLIKTVSAAFAQ